MNTFSDTQGQHLDSASSVTRHYLQCTCPTEVSAAYSLSTPLDSRVETVLPLAIASAQVLQGYVRKAPSPARESKAHLVEGSDI